MNAAILLITITTEVNEVVTGLIGVVFIIAAFISSVVRNKHKTGEHQPADQHVTVAS
jgi:hypothetical protein